MTTALMIPSCNTLFAKVKFTLKTIQLETIFYSCPVRKLFRSNCSRGNSFWGNFMRGNFPGESIPGGCFSGNCPGNKKLGGSCAGT